MMISTATKNVIKRGSTNENIFQLPADLPLDDLQKILILYYQHRTIVIRKETSDVDVDKDAHTISTKLSETDTLKFAAGVAALEVCIKYASGDTLRSHIHKVEIEDTLLSQEV